MFPFLESDQILTFVFGAAFSSIVFLLQRWLDKEKFKFTKLHELRIEKLSELYSIFVDFSIQDKLLTQVEDKTTEEIKQLTNDWSSKLKSLFDFYHKNRILFPQKIKSSLNDFIQDAVLFNKQLLFDKQKVEEKMIETPYSEMPYEMSDTIESEELSKRIGTSLKNRKQSYELIRGLLESEFDRMVKEKI